MPSTALLALDGCYVSSLGGFADVLQVANSHLIKLGGSSAPLFEWQFVSPTGGVVCASNGLQIPSKRIVQGDHFDLVFVPSLHYRGHREFDAFLKKQRSACDWLISQWKDGATLVANCTGTFVLATTGLLDNRLATSTWWLEQQFRRRFPLVDLQLRPVITEIDRLICAGAAASYLLQAVRVVERFSGSAIAAQTAKSMLIDVSQTTQTPYLPLMTERIHTDSLVSRAQVWLEDHMADSVRIGDLASRLAVSERTLIRRFQAALRESPVTYLQNMRIDAARTQLQMGDLSVKQVASRVGYNDASSFSRLFKECVGLAPGAYRARFRAVKL